MGSGQKESCHVTGKIETFTEEDTRTTFQDSDTSVPLKGGTLGPHTVLPIATCCCTVFS